MSTLGNESVLSVHHWNDTLFSFRTTRDPALRFENGHFVMIGLEVDSKPLMRAYSIVSANHDEHQYQGARRPADLAPAAPEGRRLAHRQPQAGRHPGDA